MSSLAISPLANSAHWKFCSFFEIFRTFRFKSLKLLGKIQYYGYVAGSEFKLSNISCSFIKIATQKDVSTYACFNVCGL